MSTRKPLPKDPLIRSLVAAQLASRRMSRRSLMTGIGAAGMLGALAACGTSGTGTSSEGLSPAEDLSEQEKQLFWANWTLYLDYDDSTRTYPSLERFQEQTGIEVTYAEDINGNETYYGTIQSQLNAGQDFGQDIVTFTDWMAARLISQGVVQELDHANIPNLQNLLPNLLDVEFDPGRQRSVTWQSGMAGIAWNKEELPDGLHSVSDLWNTPELRGRVTVLDEMRDTMGLLMLDEGVDITSFTAEDFENAIDVLAENITSGQIRQVRGNDYKEDLVSGDALAAICWSGDITQLNFEEGDRWEFVIPEAGGTLWSDNLLVPMGATHKTNAETLMNYYLDPEVAAEVAAYVNFVCPVVGAKEAMEQVDPELVDDPLIFPSDEDLQHVSVFRALEADEESEFIDLFQRTIGN
ncbi:spermidine/putrescine ABC transporter substrate-binding protein [Sediminivirga luteola]|uniref:ABC transporter substrate-binding protein n=2 Tax=Sediminivirga luteola TaxID=1774748 RepID=A0A8J2TY49_9MICO|nr:ABC transporter substrate-binding protein [Sediminivirga luteola]